ncbi:hypothetical protein JAAARDRAFT_194820 [Jaapia argillacea MUCL 33604]|uniref:F-box domain-containing protein n=1 Tax=Jaapia argillacea MUCL 33604 TaxID=933084 RepID=A0A067PSS0_9AGAM|nr:hypothetical protein JAAARDRAFT_194820 [Jaapia argillacea MUCL 33604]
MPSSSLSPSSSTPRTPIKPHISVPRSQSAPAIASTSTAHAQPHQPDLHQREGRPPRLPKLFGLTQVLGVPFPTGESSDGGGQASASPGDVVMVDGAFSSVPRQYTITRPSSPAPTMDFSMISPPSPILGPNGELDPFGVFAYAPHSPFSHRPRAYTTGSSPCGRNGVGLGGGTKGLLPRIWDALSSPGKKAKEKAKATANNATGFDCGHDEFGEIQPLDGEEGELIDEACFIDVRAVTGIDILSRLPPELSLHILLFLDLHSVLACLCVSRTWRGLASDNGVWKGLFGAREGWGVDLPKARAIALTEGRLTDKRGSSMSFVRNPSGATTKVWLDWRELFRNRLELENRWVGGEPWVTRISGHGDRFVAFFFFFVLSLYFTPPSSPSVYCLEFDSSRIITGSRDRSIKVWELKSGKLLATFRGHAGSVLCLKFDKDWDVEDVGFGVGVGSSVGGSGGSVVGLDGEVSGGSLREASGGSSGREVSGGSLGGGSALVKRESVGARGKKGFMVSGSSDCSVCVWDLFSGGGNGKGGEVRAEVRAVLRGHTGGVLDLRIDEKWIVSCSKDALIRVWNRDTLALHTTLRGHEGPVNAVGLQGGKVVSASGDGKMMLWDIGSGERLRIFEGHDRGLACIEFKDDIIVSGSNDCKIKIWSASTGQCLRTLDGHDSLVRALAFDPKSGRLVSASYDKTVKVWDWRSGRCVREYKRSHTSHIFDVKFDVCRIVSTSHDQKIVVLDFSQDLDTRLFV